MFIVLTVCRHFVNGTIPRIIDLDLDHCKKIERKILGLKINAHVLCLITDMPTVGPKM